MSDTLNDGEQTPQAETPAVETVEAPAVEPGTEAQAESAETPAAKPAADTMPAWRRAQREAKLKAELEQYKRKVAAYEQAPAPRSAGSQAPAPQTYDENQLWVQSAVAPAVAQHVQPLTEKLTAMERYIQAQEAEMEQRQVESFWTANKDVPDEVKAAVEERVAYAYANREIGPDMSPIKARELALTLTFGEMFQQEKTQRVAAAKTSAVRVAQANKVAAAEGGPSAPPKAATKNLADMTFAELRARMRGQ